MLIGIEIVLYVHIVVVENLSAYDRLLACFAPFAGIKDKHSYSHTFLVFSVEKIGDLEVWIKPYVRHILLELRSHHSLHGSLIDGFASWGVAVAVLEGCKIDAPIRSFVIKISTGKTGHHLFFAYCGGNIHNSEMKCAIFGKGIDYIQSAVF